MKKHILWIGFFLSLLITHLNAQTVFITKTGEKYHTNDCRHLSNSRSSIELNEALNKGYEACKVCRPTQTPANSKQKINKENALQQNTASHQCSAPTSKGARCKHKTNSANGFC